MRRFLLFTSVLILAGCSTERKVGEQPDGSIVVPTNQTIRPAGKQIEFAGRPIDISVSPDQQTVFAKTDSGFEAIDVSTQKITASPDIKGGTSLCGIQAMADGSVWVSDAGSSLQQAVPNSNGYQWKRKIDLPKKIASNAYPCGFKIEGNQAFVCDSLENELVQVDLATGKILSQIPTDIAPFDIAIDGTHAWISCWGGPQPPKAARTQKSNTTDVEVDERGVVKSATVVCVDLQSHKLLKRIKVGLQPAKLKLSKDHKKLFVPNANADSVSIIDTVKMRLDKTINVKPDKNLLFGSAPNAVELSEDEKTLYVCNGGNNVVAVVNTRNGNIDGLIPAGWYPAGIARIGNKLWIANAKGVGTRKPRESGGFSSYDIQGTVSVTNIPNEEELAAMSRIAGSDSLIYEAEQATERAYTNVPPATIPLHPRQPSNIEHVVYIIKENRTYDQVLGDLAQANGDPKFCVFPREVTPNEHALAENFVLLDNYYCNGTLSADGHAWADEGNATSYFEHAFGGWTRSYPFGDDPLAVSTTGFLWDHVLASGKSFENFGEFDNADTVPNSTWSQIYEDYKLGRHQITFKHSIGVGRMRTYSDPDYPGWNLSIPDQVRADIFIRKLAAMKTMPNLTIIHLPQDHTSGTSPGMPTPRAMVADNDLALGRIVEALSRSKYWPKMAIFIEEDDPQNGFDHVDGHRSFVLLASPYAKRNALVHSFHNQLSVLHTICLMLGIRPLNQLVAMSEPMRGCFKDRPDLTPYTALHNLIPLDEMNPDKSKLKGKALQMAKLSQRQDFKKPDAANDDDLNRIIWSSVKGTAPYPAAADPDDR